MTWLNASTQPIKNLSSNILSVSIVLACLLWQSVSLQAQTIEYPKVAPNVPFSDVAKLTPIAHSAEISYGEHPDQKVLFWPAVGNKQNNTLIFIHGGCWLAKFDIKHSLAITSALAQSGFDVYSIEYRRTGNGGEWPVALNDIQLAFSAIRLTLAPNKHVYNAPISILGHSAGGHLATLAAINIAPDNFTNVHLFGLAPIIDLVAYARGENNCQTATPVFMGGMPMEKVQAYKDADPLEYKMLISKTSDEMSSLKSAVMMIGNQDEFVPQNMAKHPSAKFVVVDKAGHFDWIHPGSNAFKQLLDKLTAVSSTN